MVRRPQTTALACLSAATLAAAGTGTGVAPTTGPPTFHSLDGNQFDPWDQLLWQVTTPAPLPNRPHVPDGNQPCFDSVPTVGSTCGSYDRMKERCGTLDTANFSAAIMCCVCGGGSVVAPTSPPSQHIIISPPISPPSPFSIASTAATTPATSIPFLPHYITRPPKTGIPLCIDNALTVTVKDSVNMTCGSYHGRKERCGTFDTANFSAAVMCCACGGGMGKHRDFSGNNRLPVYTKLPTAAPSRGFAPGRQGPLVPTASRTAPNTFAPTASPSTSKSADADASSDTNDVGVTVPIAAAIAVAVAVILVMVASTRLKRGAPLSGPTMLPVSPYDSSAFELEPVADGGSPGDGQLINMHIGDSGPNKKPRTVYDAGGLPAAIGQQMMHGANLSFSETSFGSAVPVSASGGGQPVNLAMSNYPSQLQLHQQAPRMFQLTPETVSVSAVHNHATHPDVSAPSGAAPWMGGPACQANALSAAAMAQPAGLFHVPGISNVQILDAQYQTMASDAAAPMPGGHVFTPHNQQALAQVATGQGSTRQFAFNQQHHLQLQQQLQQRRQLQQQQHYEQQQLRIQQQQQQLEQRHLQQQQIQLQQQQLHRQLLQFDQQHQYEQQQQYERQQAPQQQLEPKLEPNQEPQLEPKLVPQELQPQEATQPSKTPQQARRQSRGAKSPTVGAAAVKPVKPIKPIKPIKPRFVEREQRASPAAGKDASVRTTYKSNTAVRICKYKAIQTVSPEDWRLSIRKACKTAFARLTLLSEPRLSDSILERIEAGADLDEQAWAPKCFLVQRDHPESTSPFQLQVMGARILAQKTIYAAYRDISPVDIGTWQVQQRCIHNDGSWWCFEPSHLERYSRQNMPNAEASLPIPGAADAIYAPQKRKPKKGLAWPAKSGSTTTSPGNLESSNVGSPAPEDAAHLNEHYEHEQPVPPVGKAQLRSLQPHLRASPLQHRSSLMHHPTGGQADMVLNPLAQSILANVQSQQPQQQPVSVSQPDALANFKESWDFPAVSLAEVLSGPEGTHHDVGNVSGSGPVLGPGSDRTFFLPQTMQDLATSFATSTSAPTQDDTGSLFDVLSASSA